MRVLILEDDEATRQALEAILAGQGMEWRSTGDVKTARGMLRDFWPDLVFLDLDLAGSDSLETLEVIRGLGEGILVIVLVTPDRMRLAGEALRRGATDFLRRPPRAEEAIPLLRKYARVVATRRGGGEAARVRAPVREFTFEMESQPEMVAEAANRLVGLAGFLEGAEARVGAHLGLVELLNNAVEHGNLEITSQEKWDRINSEGESYAGLIERRLRLPKYQRRRVRIHTVIHPEFCDWIVQDEGEGFNWRRRLASLDLPDGMQQHGRGILLCRYHFDELEYIGKGNIARARKRRPPPGGSPGAAAVETTEPASAAAARRPRVLARALDGPARLSLEEALEALEADSGGLDVRWAESRAEAAEALRAWAPDVALVALRAFVAEENESLEIDSVVARRMSVPVVAVAPSDDLRRIARALNRGAWDYLLSPLNPESLRARVAAAMRLPSAGA